MASGEEDEDLLALRTAVLASMKGKSKDSSDYSEDEDLVALREAALKTKKPSSDSRKCSPAPSSSTQSSQSVFPPFQYGGRGSNLIVISTVDGETSTDESPTKPVKSATELQGPKLLRPQDKWLSENSTSATSSPQRPKVVDKFSRFESSNSESDNNSDSSLSEDDDNKSEASKSDIENSSEADQSEQSGDDDDSNVSDASFITKSELSEEGTSDGSTNNSELESSEKQNKPQNIQKNTSDKTVHLNDRDKIAQQLKPVKEKQKEYLRTNEERYESSRGVDLKRTNDRRDESDSNRKVYSARNEHGTDFRDKNRYNDDNRRRQGVQYRDSPREQERCFGINRVRHEKRYGEKERDYRNERKDLRYEENVSYQKDRRKNVYDDRFSDRNRRHTNWGIKDRPRQDKQVGKQDSDFQMEYGSKTSENRSYRSIAREGEAQNRRSSASSSKRNNKDSDLDNKNKKVTGSNNDKPKQEADTVNEQKRDSSESSQSDSDDHSNTSSLADDESDSEPEPWRMTHTGKEGHRGQLFERNTQDIEVARRKRAIEERERERERREEEKRKRGERLEQEKKDRELEKQKQNKTEEKLKEKDVKKKNEKSDNLQVKDKYYNDRNEPDNVEYDHFRGRQKHQRERGKHERNLKEKRRKAWDQSDIKPLFPERNEHIKALFSERIEPIKPLLSERQEHIKPLFPERRKYEQGKFEKSSPHKGPVTRGRNFEILPSQRREQHWESESDSDERSHSPVVRSFLSVIKKDGDVVKSNSPPKYVSGKKNTETSKFGKKKLEKRKEMKAGIKKDFNKNIDVEKQMNDQFKTDKGKKPKDAREVLRMKRKRCPSPAAENPTKKVTEDKDHTEPTGDRPAIKITFKTDRYTSDQQRLKSQTKSSVRDRLGIPMQIQPALQKTYSAHLKGEMSNSSGSSKLDRLNPVDIEKKIIRINSPKQESSIQTTKCTGMLHATVSKIEDQKKDIVKVHAKIEPKKIVITKGDELLATPPGLCRISVGRHVEAKSSLQPKVLVDIRKIQSEPENTSSVIKNHKISISPKRNYPSPDAGITKSAHIAFMNETEQKSAKTFEDRRKIVSSSGDSRRVICNIDNEELSDTRNIVKNFNNTMDDLYVVKPTRKIKIVRKKNV